MTTLTRASLRNIWLLSAASLLVLSYLVYGSASDVRAGIEQSRLDLDAVQRELENVQRLSASLAQLDANTLNENTATRLEILRHLGLEQTDFNVEIASRAEQQVGNTVLYQRTIKISVDLPYAEALALIDRFHNEGRMVLNRVSVAHNPEDPETVKLELEGITFGLPKKAST